MNVTERKSISVIIPTLNGEKTLPEFFGALKMQSVQPDEILVVDSSSNDNSVEICRANGANIVTISRAEFDHGGTRTTLAKESTGEIIVFFTQDAILATRDALELLIAPLLENKDIACSCGRQLPRKNASVIASHLRFFNYPPKSSVRGYEDRHKFGLKTIFISNSFAAYKKEQLKEVRYFKNGLIFGEDTCTLGRLLVAGHRVAYVSEAAVYHSHNYAIIDEFKRSFDIGVLHSSEQWLMDTYGTAEGVGATYIRSVFSMLFRERKFLLMIDCFIRSACKFAGYKLGRSYRKLPGTIRPALSMHKLWWQKHN
jgi:rhamnosyltransferase